MIKFEKTEVVGWESAIRGMRNPMNSWDKSDTVFGTYWGEVDGHKCFDNRDFTIGQNDLKLMKTLCKAGTDHRKFMRMITVYVDITAPLYWWKEADTYKIGTVSNSCSTMHKIADKEFTRDDFSTEHIIEGTTNCDPMYYSAYKYLLMALNEARHCFIDTKDKTYWWQMIQLLPTSYNQKRTIMLNYETLTNIYHSRKNHKLDEWKHFCSWIESLPYSELITGEEINK